MYSCSVAKASLAARRVEQWQETFDYCAKCRGNSTQSNAFEVNGLAETFSVLKSLFEDEVTFCTFILTESHGVFEFILVTENMG